MGKPGVAEWWQAIVLILQAILLGVGIAHHEPWFDEAQAWLIAQDASIWEIITVRGRYEGSPVLWHLLLAPFAKAGFPYVTINVIAACFSLASSYLVLRFSPFSVPVKWLFPFGFYPIFQYGIIGRSYCLALFAILLLAAMFNQRSRRPWSYLGALALLATSNGHGFLIANGIFWMAWLSDWRIGTAEARRKSLRYAFAILGISFLVVLTASTPADIAFPKASGPVTQLKPDVWRLAYLFGAFSKNAFVSLIILVISVCWFIKRKVALLFLMPLALLLLLFVVRYANVWHEGMIFALWLFCFWVSLVNLPPSSSQWVPNMTVLVVLLIHLSWGITSWLADFRSVYSPARLAAAELHRRLQPGDTVGAVGFSTVALLPYFDHNIYVNLAAGASGRYHRWSQSAHLDDPIPPTLQPTYVVYGIKRPSDLVGLQDPRYEEIVRFEGAILWKDAAFEPDGYVIYQVRRYLLP
jgi:hypothetical protein